ncbi:MAG: VOC family protein [Cyclobacteriaceae bacterium]|nr:VOC family protein [Cyclobacteriaceae bacterium SS2]
MKSKGLRTTIYQVPDLQAAKKWYTKAFETEPYFDEPFYVGFDIAGYELGLIPGESKREKSENIFSYWGVDDIDAAHADLISKGATPFEEIMEVGDNIKVASLKDPWSNIIGIIYNPNFKL